MTVGSGGGRQGQHGRPAQVVDGMAQGQEIGAEVMAPLADAVGLVHHEQTDGPAPEQLAEARDRPAARAC